MRIYNWQKDDWPDFTYSLDGVEEMLLSLIERMGRVTGKLEAMPEDSQQEAIINMMVAEAVKTSQIEGEYISRKDVLSSIRRNLGLHSETDQIKDKRAAGLAELMIAVRNTWKEP